MACWNGLSETQQQLLIHTGVLPAGRWNPEGGECEHGAQVAIETEYDEAPGPRFYCVPCALNRLTELRKF